jgi:hypothetical protein
MRRKILVGFVGLVALGGFLMVTGEASAQWPYRGYYRGPYTANYYRYPATAIPSYYWPAYQTPYYVAPSPVFSTPQVVYPASSFIYSGPVVPYAPSYSWGSYYQAPVYSSYYFYR